MIRLAEDELITGNRLQLEDILANCNIKPQFAKTYRVLRRDKRETLEKMRENLNASRGDNDLVPLVMMRMYDRVMSYKLREMEYFFLAKWNEDIEAWAGEEGSTLDRSGCLVFIAAGISIVCSTFALLIFLFK